VSGQAASATAVRFLRWLANFRVLEIDRIEAIPYLPVSHPSIERLIGAVRREHLDRVFFLNWVDLTRKLKAFQYYYNEFRVQRLLGGSTPAQRTGASSPAPAMLHSCGWRQRCQGLFPGSMAAQLRNRDPHAPTVNV